MKFSMELETPNVKGPTIVEVECNPGQDVRAALDALYVKGELAHKRRLHQQRAENFLKVGGKLE